MFIQFGFSADVELRADSGFAAGVCIRFWRRIAGFGEVGNGIGLFGFSTGSYGSLQQSLQNSFVLPIQTSPATARKPQKMLLPGGPREKERLMPWIYKMACRRRVGMFLLVIVSVGVFLSLIDASSQHNSPPTSGDEDSIGGGNLTYVSKVQSASVENKTWPLLPPPPPPLPPLSPPPLLLPPPPSPLLLPPPPPYYPPLMSILPHGHPCETFALPPPPADKKRTGPRPCPVCYLPVEQAMALMPVTPSTSPLLKQLTYNIEESPSSPPSFGGSSFGGYPSLQQRNDSFDIRESMSVHCGFVRGNRPGRRTGFDIDEDALVEMEQCRGVVVASAVFGNYDIIQQPKNISEAAKKNACFYMFVDEETEAYVKNSSALDSTNRVGLWRIVVVHNLPYNDARRNGKKIVFVEVNPWLMVTVQYELEWLPIPILIAVAIISTTRKEYEDCGYDTLLESVKDRAVKWLFPNARFSIWIDGKLELVVDPYQILERIACSNMLGILHYSSGAGQGKTIR
ncbi:hypothetical protein ACLOJK_008582 [Asimina triloba]